jgi:hypothetical protein
MMNASDVTVQKPSTRWLTVLAQDPDVADKGGVITTRVKVPAEPLFAGPRGSRVEIVDYDASSDCFYGPFEIPENDDPFEIERDREALVGNPRFHAQNVYGIVASTLFEFERALGRHLSWGFEYGSHQLKVFPHAFAEPNAFYSKCDECLAFGYFPVRGPDSEKVFTCLSHDIVTHETTHALIDGLRDQLMRPSSDDQAAFHEGFADIIAILKTLQNLELVQFAINEHLTINKRAGTVSVDEARAAIQNQDILFGLAKQMGKAVRGMGRGALRHSTEIKPSKDLYTGESFRDPHDRGELLVAAVMHGFQLVWDKRLSGKLKLEGREQSPRVAAWRVAEEGAKAAGHLLHMMIRAIDYLPPVHVDFGDFLSAILTADWQICPDDDLYGYRDAFRASFAAYGIEPAYNGVASEPGVWGPGTQGRDISYARANMDSLRWNREGMFKLLWENYNALDLDRDIFTKVNSVRPVWRIGPEGFILRETVAEYYQKLNKATQADLKRLGIDFPESKTGGEPVDLVGGGTLIFDEFGRLKFHIHNRITNGDHQRDRLDSLWRRGALHENHTGERPFTALHRRRAADESRRPQEAWD